MQKIKLSNGLTIITKKRDSESVTILVNVNTGSNYEKESQLGISHFIEHMLFEGTKKRSTNAKISNEIERLGGELNAYTSNERTVYYVKVSKKHFDIALDIISDIILNPLFNKKMVEKERKVILQEINMVTDEPRFHLWVLFSRALFKDHPAKNPPYGKVETVKKIKRKDLIDYYRKYYVSDNIIISVVGNINGADVKVSKAFAKAPKGNKNGASFKAPPNKQTLLKEKKLTLHSYMVLGYKIPGRLSKESYIFDVIKAIFSRGQSGRIVEDIRGKKGIAYEVNALSEPAKDYGLFAVYLNTDKKNMQKSKDIILGHFGSLEKLSKKELDDAKGYVEGKYTLENEDTHTLADELSFWEMVGDARLASSYTKEIMKITKKDIVMSTKKFLNDEYSLAVIEQAN